MTCGPQSPPHPGTKTDTKNTLNSSNIGALASRKGLRGTFYYIYNKEHTKIALVTIRNVTYSLLIRLLLLLLLLLPLLLLRLLLLLLLLVLYDDDYYNYYHDHYHYYDYEYRANPNTGPPSGAELKPPGQSWGDSFFLRSV